MAYVLASAPAPMADVDWAEVLGPSQAKLLETLFVNSQPRWAPKKPPA